MILVLSFLVDMSAAFAFQQFGLSCVALVICGAVSVLGWAGSASRKESWSARRRRLFWRVGFILCTTPILLTTYAVLFRCRGIPSEVSSWKATPIPVCLALQVAAEVTFVVAAKGIRTTALAAIVIPLVAIVFVAFISLFLIGGEGP